MGSTLNAFEFAKNGSALSLCFLTRHQDHLFWWALAKNFALFVSCHEVRIFYLATFGSELVFLRIKSFCIVVGDSTDFLGVRKLLDTCWLVRRKLWGDCQGVDEHSD